MYVDVVQHEVTKIVIVEKRLEPVSSSSPENKEIILAIAFGVVGAIILLLVLLCLCKRCRNRQRLRKGRIDSSNSTIETSTSIYSIPTDVQLRTPEDVARRYERSVSSISTKSQVYLVPFAVLPPDFDYSSREVEVKADYVILKDLKFLEKYSSTRNGGIVNEAFESQEPYNPYAVGTIPPLIQEPYKKQAAYNPSFY